MDEQLTDQLDPGTEAQHQQLELEPDDGAQGDPGAAPAGELEAQPRAGRVVPYPPAAGEVAERKVLAVGFEAGERRELRAGDVVYRSVAAEPAAVDLEARTVELCASSEYPVRRWWGIEILDHSPGSVRMQRIESGMCSFLEDHERAKHRGRIIGGRIDKDRKLRVTAKLSRKAAAQELLEDFEDDVRPGVSLGYIIHEAVLERTGEDEPDVYRVTDWEPFEISSEPIPADPTVGIGRTLDTPAPTSSPQQEQPARVQDVHEREHTEVDKMDPVKLERERVAAIRQLGEQFAQYDTVDLVRQFCDNGGSVEEFQQALLAKLAQRGHPMVTSHEDQRAQAQLGLGGQDLERYSLYRAIRTQLRGADLADCGLELEVHRAMRDKLGREARGVWIPYEALTHKRRLSAAVLAQMTPAQRFALHQLQERADIAYGGGTGSGGKLVGTDHMAADFIDMLRVRMVCTLAGAQLLDGLHGNVSIPRRSAGATGYWIAETGSVTESSPTFDAVALSPKTLVGRVDITRRMMVQSSPAVEGLTQDDLALCLAAEIDKAGLAGTGQNDQPTGAIRTTGVTAVVGGTDGAVPTWAKVVEFETKCAAANGDQGALAYVTTPGLRGVYKTTEKVSGSGRFIMEGNDQLNGYPVFATNQLPTNLVKGGSGAACHAQAFGNWRDLLLGLWGPLDLKVDEVTLGDSGGVILRAFQEADVAYRHPAGLAVQLDAKVS